MEKRVGSGLARDGLEIGTGGRKPAGTLADVNSNIRDGGDDLKVSAFGNYGPLTLV